MFHLAGAAIIAAALAAGELVKISFALPTPAPVIAILILFLAQVILSKTAPRLCAAMQSVANILVRNMALFFIPVLVLLLLEQRALLLEYGAILLAIIIPSTAAALIFTAALFVKFIKGKEL